MKIFKTIALSLGIILSSCTILLSANDFPSMRTVTEDFKHFKRFPPQPCTYPGEPEDVYICFLKQDPETEKAFVFFTRFGSPNVLDIRTRKDAVWPDGKVDYDTLKEIYGKDSKRV